MLFARFLYIVYSACACTRMIISLLFLFPTVLEMPQLLDDRSFEAGVVLFRTPRISLIHLPFLFDDPAF